jgi:hypothetical protein
MVEVMRVELMSETASHQLLYKFFEWPVTDPDGFIKWAKEAMMKGEEKRLVEEVRV